MDRTQYANLASCIVLFVVLQLPVSFLFVGYSLYGLGKQSTIAPLPIPFRDAAGFENYVYKRNVSVYKNGQDISEQAKILIEPLLEPGPHKRKIPFIVAVNWAPRLERPWIEPMYEYTVCQQLSDPHDEISLQINYENRRLGTVDHTITYACK